MEINEKLENGKLTISLEGRLDTMTAPGLEQVIEKNIKEVSNLEFDFDRLEYISSAGLRVLLEAQKKMSMIDGNLNIINVNEMVMDVFETTGFNAIMSISKK